MAPPQAASLWILIANTPARANTHGFTNGLSSQCAAHLSRVHQRPVELGFYFIEDPVKCLPGKMELFDYTTRSQYSAHVRVECER